MPKGADEQVRRESLQEEVAHIMAEARMLLPGIQALFGFQLVAAFSTPFYDRLTGDERELHLVALGLSAVAAGMIMTPAAFHRLGEPGLGSRRFVNVSTGLMFGALLPLLVGMCSDIYVIARIVLGSRSSALVVASALGCILFGLWFVFPLTVRRFTKGP